MGLVVFKEKRVMVASRFWETRARVASTLVAAPVTTAAAVAHAEEQR
jgi:hypothetical protein